MNEKDTGPKKPFYEDIVASRKRAQRPSKRGNADGQKGGNAAPKVPQRAGAGAKDATGAAGRRDRAEVGARRDSSARSAPGGHGSRAPKAAPGAPRTPRTARGPRPPYAGPKEFSPVFGALSPESRRLLEAFPEMAQSVFPLDSKRVQLLPSAIRELSHELTDERGDRRVGYLNDPAELSAYVHYYMWWNLVRLSRLFSALPLEFADGDAAVDLGSGPLTVPIALWLSRPEFRSLRLTWYCVDISQGALAAGEELFLLLAAKTGGEPWQIVRIKGELGVSLRRKVAFVASANMFNELFWDNPEALEAQAKRHAGELSSYADRRASVLVVEPGVPRSGHFVSLLRDSLMRLGFAPASPCPHDGVCPFPGHRYGKWCHFVFATDDAPARLHKLSEDAGLSKDRAALSFILSKRSAETPALAESSLSPDAEGSPAPETTASVSSRNAPDSPEMPSPASETVSRLSGLFSGLRVRITSDPIKLPDFYIGRYGCSERGMVLVTGTYQAADYLQGCHSGSLIELPQPDRRNPERDAKTGAIVIRLK